MRKFTAVVDVADVAEAIRNAWDSDLEVSVKKVPGEPRQVTIESDIYDHVMAYLVEYLGMSAAEADMMVNDSEPDTEREPGPPATMKSTMENKLMKKGATMQETVMTGHGEEVCPYCDHKFFADQGDYHTPGRIECPDCHGDFDAEHDEDYNQTMGSVQEAVSKITIASSGFDKFMDEIVIKERMTVKQTAEDTPARIRARRHQERPLNRIRVGK